MIYRKNFILQKFIWYCSPSWILPLLGFLCTSNCVLHDTGTYSVQVLWNLLTCFSWAK